MRREEPGRAERGAGDRRSTRAGPDGARRARAGLAAAAEPIRRRDGYERQDHDDGAAGSDLACGRPAGGARRQRGEAAGGAGGGGGRRDHHRLRGVELPGGGLGGARPRHGAAAERDRGPPRSSRQRRGLPRGEAARVRKPDAGAGGRRSAGGRGAWPRAQDRVRGVAATGGGDPAAWGAQPGERPGRVLGGDRLGRAGGGGGGRAAHLPRSAAPARGGGLGERCPLRERLQGHECLLGRTRYRGVRRRRARDPRRQPQGRRLRGPSRGGGFALRGGLPDRRGGGAPGAGSRRHRAAPPRRRPAERCQGRDEPRTPATWCCSRPRAPASTSSATTRSVARPSGRWSRGDESGAGRRKTSGCPGSARSSTRSSTPPRSACSPEER